MKRSVCLFVNFLYRFKLGNKHLPWKTRSFNLKRQNTRKNITKENNFWSKLWEGFCSLEYLVIQKVRNISNLMKLRTDWKLLDFPLMLLLAGECCGAEALKINFCIESLALVTLQGLHNFTLPGWGN